MPQLQAMVDIAADAGVISTTLRAMQLSQCIVQARFPDESTLRQVPHCKDPVVGALQRAGASCLPEAMELPAAKLRSALDKVCRVCGSHPCALGALSSESATYMCPMLACRCGCGRC